MFPSKNFISVTPYSTRNILDSHKWVKVTEVSLILAFSDRHYLKKIKKKSILIRKVDQNTRYTKIQEPEHNRNTNSFIKKTPDYFQGNGLLDRLIHSSFFFFSSQLMLIEILYQIIPTCSNKKFTYYMFQNVVNYLYPLFTLSVSLLLPKANRRALKMPAIYQEWENL